MLSEEDKQYIIEKGTDELHFTLGLWICNNWLYPQSQEDTEELLKTFGKNALFYYHTMEPQNSRSAQWGLWSESRAAVSGTSICEWLTRMVGVMKMKSIFAHFDGGI